MLKYNYVYRLDHIKTGEFYFGSRTSKYHPTIDEYKGSMRTWKPDKTKLIKTILRYDFKTRKEAVLYEAELISKQIDDPLNRNYHIPPNTFHTEGRVSVKDKDGNTMSVSVNDPRYLSGELVSVMTGKVCVRDKQGNTMRVSVTDPKYLSGELVCVMKGTVVVKDENGNTFRVSINDPRYSNGELVPLATGTITVKDKDGNTMRISVYDPRFLSGELVAPFRYKHHSKETKNKMSKTKQRNKSAQGENNSQYGKCWIYNEELKQSKSVKKEEIQFWLDKDWIEGRKMKFY